MYSWHFNISVLGICQKSLAPIGTWLLIVLALLSMHLDWDLFHLATKKASY